jgi:hypothetical protein
MTRHAKLLISMLAVTATALSACGQETASSPTSGNHTSRTAQTIVASADLSFFEPLRPSESAILKRQPPSLKDAYREATATVLAQVADVRPGRLLKDLQWIDVELDVVEVLEGALQPELDRVVVEFPGAFLPDSNDPMVEKMRSHLPKGASVWLLRWEAAPPPASKPGAPRSTSIDPTRYVIVHPNCGVFVQTPAGAVAATAQNDGLPSEGAQAEGERFARLSDLASHARKNR